MSATIDITCEYCAVQEHESEVWRKVECHDDMTRQEVWCCNECYEEDDDKFTCDRCNCVKDREHYVSVDGDVSGDTICDECVDEDDLVVDTENAHPQILSRMALAEFEARRLVQTHEIIYDNDEDFEEDDHGVLCFKSETKGWLYAEPYCFNCGHKAGSNDCICEEDERDWRDEEYEANFSAQSVWM